MGSTGITLADLPNIFIMIGALVALFIMLVILLRNMEIIGIVGEGAAGMPWRGSPPRLLMQRVHIPFTFKLSDTRPISYSDVECIVSAKVNYFCGSWWGAPVRDLHHALWGSLQDLLTARPCYRSGPHEERIIHLGIDQPPPLGAPPRTCYPLVVVLARDLKQTDDLRPDDTVALVTVVHIRDEQCPLPTGILAQYLKQANGQLSCLKQLYVSGECPEDEENDEAAGTDEYGEPAALCCVCTARPLSRALLPCRHACLCSACLPKLDKCPICRCIIHSYFSIRNEEEPLSEYKPQNQLNQRLFNLFHYH
ncbi:Cell growth regulator with RING finger domain protein 1 [Eumeta japonica]|uniref:Cell growth regulator with RING finger domain protein 1 n=1 Tax=Eumeta variegata TaxID=151549 RepID=A0A4C1UDA8_EUMVA|nr:Cell growth regulator with RING finger domain protein 1 [Eumeta japonica]